MCPFIISTACGKYLATFEYVSPGHVPNFPLCISRSHVDLFGNPDAACMYRTSDTTLGILYALYAEKVVCLLSVVWCICNSLFGFRSNCHSLVSSFSLHPVRMGLPPGENNVTYCLVNKTVQSKSNLYPTPTNVLVNDGIMYPVVGKFDANCGIGSVAVADDLCTYVQ